MPKSVGRKKKKANFNFEKRTEECFVDADTENKITQSRKRLRRTSFDMRAKRVKLSVKLLRNEDQSYRERERLTNLVKKRELRKNIFFKEKEGIDNLKRIKLLRATKEYNEQEKKKNISRITELRQSEQYREKENEKNITRNKELRQSEHYREIENEKNQIRIRELRDYEQYREIENENNIARNKELRHSEQYREIENEKNIIRNKELRQSEHYREIENEKNEIRIRELRDYEQYRAIENENNIARNKELRHSEQYREIENEKNIIRNKELRQSEHYRDIENEKNEIRIRELRDYEQYREIENEKNISRNKELRHSEQFREIENQKNIFRNKELRLDEDYKEKERARNLIIMKKMRKDENYKQREDVQDRIRKITERNNSIVRFRHSYYNTQIQSGTKCSKSILKFLSDRKNVPDFVCCCCEGLFFTHSVTKFEKHLEFESNTTIESEFYEKINNFPSTFICNTCKLYVKKFKVPKMATSNGMKFEVIPECLRNLSPLEERLCSPYIPFMQIRPLKAFAINPQLGLKGSVINIPIDINECLHILPRTFDDMATIQLQLKRNLSHKSFYMYETIRPAIVCEALKYLMKTPLYIKNKIEIDQLYLKRYEEKYSEKLEFVLEEDINQDKCGRMTNEKKFPAIESDGEDDKEIPLNSTDEKSTKTKNESKIDEIESDEEFGEEILLMDSNDDIKIIAPGQNQTPIAWHLVENIDELCFPKIFCGNSFKLGKNTTYHDRAKSECRRVDRRSCIPTRVMFMAKKKIEKQCLANVNVCLRKSKKKFADLKAKNLLNEMFVNNLINVDSGYRVLKNVRSSPAFWESKKKDLLAMIRQLKKPSFFLTLSAAESRWPELISYLSKINLNKNLSISEALELSSYEKTNLIQNDPVSCARYFDYKISKFMQLIKEEDCIFGEHTVEDSYQRVEFQMRGSPHEHMFLWLKNAPVYDASNPETGKQCIEFVDKFITCEYNENDPYVALQNHKHTHTCKKGKSNKQVCRFHFPLPVLPKTMILTPLPKQEITDSNKIIYTKIDKLMNFFFKKKTLISFEEVLKKLDINEEQYISALRSSIKTPKIFLKRTTLEVGINCYNKHILHCFESNMDIQFVLEEFGLASYIINYVSKAESGLSKLLRNAAKELEEGNVGLREQLRKVSNVFLNCQLMSAQEASYVILSLPVSKSSRKIIFINTSPQCERVLMLKNKANLEQLSPESENVFMDDIVEKYMKRAKSLDDICLAEFAACYYSNLKKINVDDENDDQCCDGNMNRRKRPAVIRYRRYKAKLDPQNYFREQVLLLVPFRDEKGEIEARDPYQIYLENIEKIELNRTKFNVVEDDTLEEAIDNLQNNDEEDSDEEDICTEPVDVFVQGGMNDKTCNNNRISIPKRINVDDLRKLILSLNNEQKQFVMHLLHRYKTNKLPFNIFLSGSAGVGKSTVIRAVYQLITHYFDRQPGSDKDKIVVLLCAPSGKAAFLINGVTLHTAFALPVAQFSGNMPRLSNDIANTLREKLINLKLLVIDEISMVGSKLLSRVDNRLRQIMGRNEPFGAVSVLVVGDLNQLPPVMDTPVYKFPAINDLEKIIAYSPLWDQFSFFELKQIMRQKDDLSFINVLNNIAVGNVSDSDVEIINSRQVKNIEIPENAIRLFSKNADVDEYNLFKINQSPGETFISVAEDHVLGSLPEKSRDRILNSIKNKKPTELNGLSNEIHLKVGLKYMITSNIDVEDGLVNGACGTLERIIFRPNSNLPRKVFINFNEERVGLKARFSQKNYMISHGIELGFTPIDKSRQILNCSNKLEQQVIRNQFPLISAEAITIHKSQGQTYNEICIDFNKLKRITRSMLYVALSRVKSLSGLYVLGEFRRPKSDNKEDPTLIELARLREDRMLRLFSDNNNSKNEDIGVINLKMDDPKDNSNEITNSKLPLENSERIQKETKINKNILCSSYYLQDDDIQIFNDIVLENTEFKPQSTLLVQIPELIESRKEIKNLQILYHRLGNKNEYSGIGHWICTYYDGKAVHVYDSLNMKILHDDCSIYINKLYGTTPINFHDVQHQRNGYDCGVFAIAFAVSICLSEDPSACIYEDKLLRSHLLKIFSERRIVKFPVQTED